MNTRHNWPVVYLAGPIAGTQAGVAFDWRDYAESRLDDYDIVALSPLRAKDRLRASQVSDDFRRYQMNGAFYTPAGILTRDHHDCTTSDAVLMNLLGATEKSFGTGMELAWTYDHHIPTVVAIEDEGNVHDGHPMFAAAVKFRLSTLDDAIDAIAVILGR